jgi:L-seryl-tRNA(Ser) seleniumtransferase
MAPEVTAAMTAASDSFVRMDALHAAVGRRIAELTGAEAGLVTSGASAGLTLAAAACLCGDRFDRMEQLPDTRSMPHEIVVARSQRNGYDHALRAAGATLVDVGVAERTRDPQPWEIEAAIGPNTVAVAFSVGFSPLELEPVVEAAHRHQIPVIVDAAAGLPPRENLRKYIAAGADLVVFSGGKGIAGPQCTGILCGRRELVASAALQMWDLDFLPELWNPPAALIDESLPARGVPNHGIGRGFKVGKEEIVGLWAALERFAARDELAELARLEELVDRLSERLQRCPQFKLSKSCEPGCWPRLRIEVVDPVIDAVALLQRLESGSPAVYLMPGEAHQRILGIDPFGLRPGDVDVLAHRVEDELRALVNSPR